MEHKELFNAIKALYSEEPYVTQHEIAVALNQMKVRPIGARQWTASTVSLFMVHHGCVRRKLHRAFEWRRPSQIGCRQCIEQGVEYDTKQLAPWIRIAIERGKLRLRDENPYTA